MNHPSIQNYIYSICAVNRLTHKALHNKNDPIIEQHLDIISHIRCHVFLFFRQTLFGHAVNV